MKQIPLTQGKVALVDDEDLERVNQFKWCAHHDKNGKWYAMGRVEGKVIYLHRLILSARKHEEVDHKNDDGLDCRRTNLRLCTSSENKYNRGKIRTNTSGYKGVTFDKRTRRWMAQITLSRKHIFIGRFETAEAAAKAYDAVARGNHGDFAHLNFD